MNLENELKQALAREKPSPGFAGRVMARIDAGERTAHAPWRGGRWMRAVAASLVLTAAAGGWTAWQVRERREGERAKEQLLQAMRIAGEKVRYAQDEVRSIGNND